MPDRKKNKNKIYCSYAQIHHISVFMFSDPLQFFVKLVDLYDDLASFHSWEESRRRRVKGKRKINPGKDWARELLLWFGGK